jgi:ABC-type multidrug transport system permease subunit
MRNIVVLAFNDLRLTLTDRGAVMWMFFLPIVFATFFGIVMSGTSSPADATASLAVVDLDGSVVSRALLSELEGEGVALTSLTPEERTTTEYIARTLIIPEGFGQAVLDGKQQTLRLEKKADASAEAALVAQARIIAAMTRLVGRLVEASVGVDEDTGVIPAAAFSAVHAPTDLVSLTTRVAGGATVIPSGFAQSYPGMAVMFVMLVALTYGAASVSSERESGNLRRLVTAPVSRSEIVAGKVAGRLVVSAAQITVLVLVGVVGSLVFGLYIGDRPFQLWLVLILFAITVAPLGVAIGGWISDPNRAASVGVILTMVMAALGGCWWPLEVVSRPLKTAALFLPTGWAMRTLHGLISFGKGLGDLQPNLLMLGGFALVFAFLATRSLRVD